MPLRDWIGSGTAFVALPWTRSCERLTISLALFSVTAWSHPNFAVPSNTQSPLTLGGNGDAVFQDAKGNFADNVGRILTTVGTGRQIQLDARFTF